MKNKLSFMKYLDDNYQKFIELDKEIDKFKESKEFKELNGKERDIIRKISSGISTLVEGLHNMVNYENEEDKKKDNTDNEPENTLNKLKKLNPNANFDSYFGFYDVTSANEFVRNFENYYGVKGFHTEEDGYVFPVTSTIEEDFMHSDEVTLESIRNLDGYDNLLDKMWN